jgi:hypothetical protein
MVEGRISCAGLLLAAFVTTFASIAHGEVYKWVDEEGNVHFGDKPQDRELAEQAEQVDIVEAYQPTERTREEQSAYERDQEALQRNRRVYEEEDRQAREAEEKKRREQKAAFCDALGKEIAKFSQMHMVGGVRTYYYLKDEEGKSVTSEQQREYVAGLKKEYADAGCE